MVLNIVLVDLCLQLLVLEADLLKLGLESNQGGLELLLLH